MAAGVDLASTSGESRAAAGWSARVRCWLIGPRVLPLAVFWLAGLALFGGFRAGLLAASRNSLAGVTAAEIVRCFWFGMRFDGFPLGILGLVPALGLALASPRAVGCKWFRRTVTAYITAVLALLLLAEIAGACYFLHYGFRMYLVALNYCQFPREALGYVWSEYPVVWGLAGMAALVSGLFAVLMRTVWRGPAPAGPAWRRAVLALGLAGACIIAIRGGVQGKPLHIRDAYLVSTNNVPCQLALNGIFSLAAEARACRQESSGPARLHLARRPQRAAEVARQMLCQPADVDLKAEGNPLWRRTVTGRPRKDCNVVIIIMEGMSGSAVGALGGRPSQTPEFDALCREGLFFDRLYAVGGRTCRGLAGVLCGHPDLAEMSITHTLSQGRFMTLPGVFLKRGYRTLFVTGGDPSWDNMKGFFSAGGVEEFIGQNDGPHADLVNPWGQADEVTFEKAHRRLLEYGDRKFFATILTTTNHEPFNPPACRVAYVPGDSLEARTINCYRYADWAIGDFFRKARAAPYFKRTLFVLVADHGREFLSRWSMDVPGNCVPCLFLAPGLVAPGRISTVASQTDIPPTVLALLGGEFDHCFMGRDILAPKDDPGFALLGTNHVLGMVLGDRAVVMPPESRATFFRVSADGQERLAEGEDAARCAELREKMLSLYYLSTQLLLDATFCPPEEAGRVAPLEAQ
jgi:phosphoglycerol transferase MdoB-like AlkP superfamily enzyme